MTRNVALVAGASGLIGRRIAERLIAEGNWEVIGLARRPPPEPKLTWIGVDLTNRDDCLRKLADLTHVTHIFYAARFDHPEGKPESVDVNAAMLANVVDAIEPVAPLRHVHAVHGSKYYGHQLGPVGLPLREDVNPRAPGVNYYFEQEDFLRSRSRGKAWSYSTTRPHCFCDPTTDHPRSIGLIIAVFAAIQRELGEPFDFPGTATGFNVHTQFTDLALLARAAAWMAQEPRCANQAFNVVNGDNPRWADLWPGFATWFGMKPGAPRGIKLSQYMADKEEIWNRIVQKHDLRPTRLDTVVLWAYGDYQLRPEWDVRSDMSKARALGFHETLDSGAMFSRQFEHYRAEKIIP